MNTLKIDNFRNTFFGLTHDWSWEIQGFLDSNGFVHPIDSDTKVISTVFERMAAPALRSIAAEHGYKVELANQTTYHQLRHRTPCRSGHQNHIYAFQNGFYTWWLQFLPA
jgi:hypothetical protein